MTQAEELLREIADELAHVRVFVSSREKIHPDGLKLFDELRVKIDACLAAPSGWVSVPREPDVKMRAAGILANAEHNEKYPVDGVLRTIRIYRAMLAAAMDE